MQSNKLRTSLRLVHSKDWPASRNLKNAENTRHLAEWAKGTPRFERYQRIEAAWRALAETEDWLEGRINPLTGRATLVA
jgi:hypothetical protein